MADDRSAVAVYDEQVASLTTRARWMADDRREPLRPGCP